MMSIACRQFLWSWIFLAHVTNAAAEFCHARNKQRAENGMTWSTFTALRSHGEAKVHEGTILARAARSQAAEQIADADNQEGQPPQENQGHRAWIRRKSVLEFFRFASQRDKDRGRK